MSISTKALAQTEAPEAAGVTQYAGPVPDLLQPSAAVRIDFDHTKFAIHLAFAGSTAGGMFAEALDRAKPPSSSWDPSGFARDLFLTQLVTQYFRVPMGSGEAALNTRYLLRLLSQPPDDIEVVAFRRDILDELARSPELRGSLTALYRELCRVRALLENTSAARSYDLNRQRLDALGAVKQVLDRMASDFGAAASGLKRLAELGAWLRAREPYRALADLLAYDEKLATLSLKISVGADGRIRSFDILSIAEASENVFVNPFWRRWLAKLELFVRGYRFSQEEVLARLIDSVFTGIDGEIVLLVQLIGDVEFYLGALGFRDRAEEVGLAVCLPELVAPEAPKELLGLFNPLLLLTGKVPVPCNLVVDPSTSTTLVTGPNSGGKTRLLQSIGVAQVLAQCGLFVPARSGRVALASSLVCSLIEGTEADQTEGRLGTELLRIRALFERLPPNAVVLLDELCSGTNPSEGERIFELVLAMLHKLRPQAFITTHFLSFAQRLQQAGSVPGLSFLQVELDPSRRATYQFTPGVAQSSLAEHVAERLGVTGEQLLELIEQNLRRWKARPPVGD
jgi:MutS-like protein